MARKKKIKLDNPFVYRGYEGSDYFCDRTEESENIISSLQNGRNITLISPRRIGKTGLIKHVFEQIKLENKDAICIYIDIFPTQNLHEFVELLGRALVEEVIGRERTIVGKVLDVFKAWRPVFSLDPLTGAPTVSVSVEPTKTEFTLKSIFDHLESLNKKVYIAIDEFQQVAVYPEKGVEALLRSHIQFSHAGFIFSGSRQHVMSEMFLSPARPFYQSTEFISLHPLHEEIYYDFVSRFFEHRNGNFSRDVFHALYHRFGGCTWYVQLLLNRLYQSYKNVEKEQQITEMILDILNTLSPQYEGLMSFLSPNQKALLTAIAKEELVVQPQAASFIKAHDLPGASSIKSSLDVLLDKELVYHQSEGYIVYDRFLALWLQRYSI